jgi:hypothetical protein
MDREAIIEEALAELDNSTSLNITGTAKKYNICPSTLYRRFHGQTQSQKTFISKSKKLLTDTQEELLLTFIDHQGQRGLFLTPRILQNIIKRTLKHEINKNWSAEFCRRHKDRIKSQYLSGFDASRHAAESVDNIALFFQNVSI